MRLPIRNYLAGPLTVFIEPQCHEHEVPVGGQAIITLEDGRPHSIDIHPDGWVSVWDEGAGLAEVEVLEQQNNAP